MTIQFKRGAGAPATLLAGEPAFDTTNFVLYVGSGTTNYKTLMAAKDLSDLASAATARTNLGLGTADSPQFTGVNVGHASDTTITRSGAGDIAVEGNAIYRAGGTDVAVADGGTGRSTATAYAVLCGGTTSTGAHQSIASVGTSGQVLTSNGAGALPTMQTLPAADTTTSGTIEVADQTEMEAAGAGNRCVTPGNANWHPGVAKGWVYFDGSGTVTINASHNVTSITDSGTGLYVVNWNTDFSSANYSIACTAAGTGILGGYPQSSPLAAGTTSLVTLNTLFNPTDADHVFCCAFGDQ